MIGVVGPPITRTGARDAARHELSKGEYHRYDDPWPIRLFHWLGHWIDRITSDVTDHSPGGAAGAVAILVVVVALAVIARWRLGPVQRTVRAPGQVLDEVVTSAAEYRRAAETAAGAGEWATAVVARMRAVARALEERGVLDARPGRTADELASEVARERPAAADALRAAAAVFDAVAYGGRDADRASYDTVVAADTAVSRTARSMQVG